MQIGRRKRRSKGRVTAVYFRTSAEEREVRRAAKRAGVPFTRLIREAALAEARRLLAA